MPLRLVALEEGSDIPIDRDLIVVGRHPTCDARLESIRVSRRHCCMTAKNGDLEVRDLGSTNGIRINGHRVEVGRLRLGDELSIAHIRFRLDDGIGMENTLAASLAESFGAHALGHAVGAMNGSAAAVLGPMPSMGSPSPAAIPIGSTEDNPLAAAVRGLLPAELAGCKIQVIVQVPPDEKPHGLGINGEAEHKED
jgi:hypothetical protein